MPALPEETVMYGADAWLWKAHRKNLKIRREMKERLSMFGPHGRAKALANPGKKTNLAFNDEGRSIHYQAKFIEHGRD